MKGLLLDRGLAPGAAALLREEDFDAIHVSEIGMELADDAAILQRAAAERRVCVTLDRDVHAHIAIAGRGSPSVILLRAQSLDAPGELR